MASGNHIFIYFSDIPANDSSVQASGNVFLKLILHSGNGFRFPLQGKTLNKRKWFLITRKSRKKTITAKSL